jgi:hypothetical protein
MHEIPSFSRAGWKRKIDDRCPFLGKTEDILLTHYEINLIIRA